MNFSVLSLDISSALLTLGVISGMTYGILAVGLVLVYRSSGVINFAHGEIGAFGAAVCGVLVVRSGVPYWLALFAGLAVSATVSAGTEMAVVRRLRNAPKLMMLVATLGVAQFLLAFSAVVNSQARQGSTFPQPSGMPEFHIGVLVVTRAYSAMLFVTPLLVFGLVLFMRYSRLGLALRAAAANSDRARMVGISASRMSTIAWALAGVVAAFTTVLIIPTRGFITLETLGPVLLLRALAPAVIARMKSLPIALFAGIGIGIVDQILIFNHPQSGVAEVVLLVIILLALFFQRRQSGRTDEKQNWGALQPWRPLPDALQDIWAIRNLGRMCGAAALAVAVLLGLFVSNNAAVSLTAIAAFSLIGLSVGVVTGLGGQLSLGQFALAGVGATVSFAITSRFGGASFVLALIYAGLITGAVSIVLGLPALRVRGLLLGVVTLSFALATQRWLLPQPWALAGGVSPNRPVFGPLSFEETRRYYFWALLILVVGFWLARNVWQGGLGLRLRAVRDNEDGARAFGVSATKVKLLGFAIAGVLAGMGGAVYGHLLAQISSDVFAVLTSINVIALTVLGGIGLLAGPVLGAFYIIGLPRFLPLDNAGLAASALGWLILILYFPGGIAQLVAIPRRRVIHWLARRHGVDPEAAETGADVDDHRAAITSHTVRLEMRERIVATRRTILRAEGLVKHFGGVHAVDGIDLTVARGEILGLMGPNGAGKTTLFELISGFTAPDSGRIEFAEENITRMSPEVRARGGLIRSFQDAALFQTLTVLETVSLAFERLQPTNAVFSAAGLHGPERRKKAAAMEVVSLMGLDLYRDKQIRELSTGTRRIADLACAVALEPVVLLLDEPSSGIAQRESEALGELLMRISRHLGCTLVVIEHDLPMLMGISTRIIAMDSGRVIASGSPEEVRNESAVITSYMGTDAAAIERSGKGAVLVGSNE